ncbi:MULTISPECIES: ParB N-terminal domain-containing protein [Streptomyces]|uniref:ParB N-terminal domain-containing protein n=1 Tax=Streptomyces TaxID=1883 RepID=UPI00131B9E8E|nr:ParB N-terminal domain-containing protein [Streptomyces sp. NRRL S-1868]
MRTTLLRNKIHPTDFQTWNHARRDFARIDHDQQIIETLTTSIKTEGLQCPLYLAVDTRHRDVYLTDGHHRAVVLMALRIRHFDFQWFHADEGGRFQRNPFPYHLLD